MDALDPALAVGAGFTVTHTTLEVTEPQPVTTAWKQVLPVSGKVVNGVVVAPLMFVHGPDEVGPDCHCIVPVYPVSVRVTVLPAQIVEGATLAVPATGGTAAVTVTEPFAVQHPCNPPVT